MIITKLELYKFTRLALNDITKFILTPMTTTNYIIGLNGSGKSSILNELTPLPANLKNYEDGGYKVINIEHENKTYILTSGVIKNKHEFIVDGSDLNVSNNKKEQIELVKSHFGITLETAKISTGLNSLTTMSAAERRKYFSNISTIDYAFAIRTFNTLKTRHRDIVGGIKILQNKMENLDSRRLTTIERENYKMSLTFLTKLKDYYYSQIKEVKKIDLNSVDLHKAKRLVKEFSKLSKVNDNIKELTGVAKALGKEIGEMVKELDSLTVESVSEDDLLRYNDLGNEIVFLSETLPDSLRNVSIDTLDGTLYSLNNAIEVSSKYIETLHILSTKTTLSDLKNMADKALNNKLKQESDIVSLEEELNILRINMNNEAVTCPSCSHKWKVGYDEKRHKELSDIVTRKHQNLKSTKETLDKLTQFINEIEHNMLVMDKVQPLLKPFIGAVSEDTLSQDLISLRVARDTFTKIIPLRKEQIKLKTKIDVVAETNNNTMVKRQETLNELLEDKYEQLETITKRLEEAEKYERYSNMLKEEHDRIKTYLKSYNIHKNNELKEEINKLYRRNILQVENGIKEMTTRLTDEEFLEREIKSLKTTLDEEIEKEGVTKKMVLGMSPTTGLIAKSINGFLGTFVNLMNDYISQVWSHSFTIQIPAIEDSELDYKFRVSVDGMPVDDIGMLSTGQQEIVNKVNVLVMTLFLRQQNYPLMLDEPFVSLSPEHKDNAFKLVDELDRQKFIISHADNTYMMNDKNTLTVFIGKDSKYNNKHYTIE